MQEWNGEFELVDPRVIVIDHRYQRQEKPNLIAAIAANPDWGAFGAVSLYRRDKTLVCVDGQQRLRGVLQSKNPPKVVPAVIQPQAPLEREAASFAAINITRKAVDTYEKHHSLICAKNPTALAIERATEKAGYTITSTSQASGQVNSVWAVAALYSVYNLLGEEGLVQVLVQARDSWPSESAGVNAHMLRGVAAVLVDQAEIYNRAKLTAALSRSTPALILRKSEELRFDFGGSKQRNVRRAIKALCHV
jgi:hypothetical protein